MVLFGPKVKPGVRVAISPKLPVPGAASVSTVTPTPHGEPIRETRSE